MQYLITFLEGVISFISPCVLPLLPVYVSYFAGDGGKGNVAYRAFAFVVGFSVVFCLLGLFAATLGALLAAYRRPVEIVCGAVVVVLGLAYLDVVPLPFLKGMKTGKSVESVVGAFLFGVVFSVSLTPCVGAFLGAALMMASVAANAVKGFFLLLLYALGMGLPFFLSALLIDKLSGAFAAIKRHYGPIRVVCGAFLIVVGIAMAAGGLDALLGSLS